MTVPTVEGITPKTIACERITTRVLFSGKEDSIPVLFVHGNASSATFWEETMLALPENYRGIAPDQRGYGEADINQKIDATRGLADLSDDLVSLMDTLNIQKAHCVGHSMGGAVMWNLMLDTPDRLLSVTLVDPGSPFGFGGTKDEQGTPCNADFAGSGGGIVSPDFVNAIADNDRSAGGQSPRFVMNNFYWKPPFVPAREEDLLSSLLSTHIGEQDYPGDSTQSANWPHVAPGVHGVANALSPKYIPDINKLYDLEPKPSILWVRGADDQIVADNSMFDMGTLGSLGAVPGYPGEDVYPPQPMVGQTRYVLEKYQESGGVYQEIVIVDAGHTPYIEKPDEFNQIFHSFLEAN